MYCVCVCRGWGVYYTCSVCVCIVCVCVCVCVCVQGCTYMTPCTHTIRTHALHVCTPPAHTHTHSTYTRTTCIYKCVCTGGVRVCVGVRLVYLRRGWVCSLVYIPIMCVLLCDGECLRAYVPSLLY